MEPMVMVVGGERIEIEKPALAFPKASGQLNGWLLYALKRRMWIDFTFRERFPAEPVYRYSFDEEVDARESASKVWSELRIKDKFTDKYFGDLQRIEAAGFLREYVWECVPHPEWHTPRGLRTEAFSQWMSANLPDHQVETWVAVFTEESGRRVVLGRPSHPPVKCQVPSLEERPSNPALNPTGLRPAG